MNEDKQEGQKTVVAFVAGLLIGGLLVWVFSDTSGDPAPETANSEEIADEITSTDGDGNEAAETPDESSVGSSDTSKPKTTPQPDMKVGDGSVSVNDQEAGRFINLDSVTFPTDEGWIGVRSYANGQLGSLLGVVRYSKEQGLVPDVIELQVSTSAGRSYAVVFYTESGDRAFSLADDVQIDEVFATFVAE